MIPIYSSHRFSMGKRFPNVPGVEREEVGLEARARALA